MKPRPVHITKISGVEMLPVAAETLEFQLVLTDANGLKQTFAMEPSAVTGLLDSHINALGLIQLHALQPKGLMV